jgi:ferredoxin
MAWLLLIPAALLTGLAALWIIGERGHLVLPSTFADAQDRGEGAPRRRLVDLVHSYIYSRWSKEYIGFVIKVWLPRMSDRTKRWWADHYHGKVITTELAKAIITIDHDIKRCDLEQIIPYPTAREIVLTNPTEVIIYDCPCRAMRENPCQPTMVCMLIGTGDFMLEHHPDKTRRITREEALDLLDAEHQRGHVHTAYFKDAIDNRFYAICNCCRCCCGGLEAMRNQLPMVTSSGFVAQVDAGLCAACGTCEELCPFDAITVNGHASVDWEKCMGCGVCEGHCDNEAITLIADERKGIPLDVRKVGVEAPSA